MKPGAVLVNVARGSLVDRAALFDALSDEAPGAARRSTSSIRSRPIPPTRCSELPNVVATPHLGASTVEAQERVSHPDRRGAPRGARRRVLRAGRQPAVPRAQGPEGAAGLDAPGRAHGALPVGAGRRPPLAAGGRDVGPARGPAAAGRRRGRQGRARGAHARDGQLRQRALRRAGPRPRRLRDAPRGAGRLRALAPRDALGRRRRRRARARRSSRAATPASSRSTACRSSSGRRGRSSSCATATCPASSAASARSSARAASTSPTSRSRAAPGARAAAVIAVDSAPSAAVLERLRAVAGRRGRPGGDLVKPHAGRRPLRRAVGRARGVADLGADDRRRRSTRRATR